MGQNHRAHGGGDEGDFCIASQKLNYAIYDIGFTIYEPLSIHRLPRKSYIANRKWVSSQS
jgi:hypothetical protein